MEADTHAPDVAGMRGTIARLLLPHGEAPAAKELETLTSLLRGHIELLIPEIEEAAAALPYDDVPRYCALACIGEARRKLRARPGPEEYDALVHARRLARSLSALCDHHESLNGTLMRLNRGRSTAPPRMGVDPCADY